MIENNDLFSIIECQARLEPERTALFFNEEKINYHDLIKKANNFAYYFLQQGIEPEDIICVISERSFAVIACIIGILQAGGAYLLIDPETPINRIKYMIKDTKSKIIFVQDDLVKKFELFKTVEIEKIYSMEITERVSFSRNEENLAYVIYTSGSTGDPKAVMIEDRNIISYVESYIELFRVNKNDIIIQQSPVCYDGFAEEIYSMLFTGGAIVLPEKKSLKHPRLIQKIINEYNVSLFATTPLMLNELNQLGGLSTVRVLISASDTLKKKFYSNLIYTNNVYNMYGPTETSVCATCYKCNLDDDDNTPIGKALSNCTIYIMDENQKPLQDGELGEIYIAGKGVARGYLNDQKLTEKCFVLINNERMYRTGDYGVFHSNGNLLFKGRKDKQVKINGHRIELCEIEAAMMEVDGIDNAIAVITSSNEDKKLISVVYTGQKEIDESTLRKLLSEKLNKYMIPTYYKKLASIPMFNNGKVDYNEISKINVPVNVIDKSIDCVNEVENKFVSIIKNIVQNNADKITMDSELNSIGIDSISFISMIVKLEDEFSITFDDEYLTIEKYKSINDVYQYIKTKIAV